MVDDKRFTLAYEKGKWWAVRDYDITLWKEDVIYLLNELHEENQQLRQKLKLTNNMDKIQYHLNQLNQILNDDLKDDERDFCISDCYTDKCCIMCESTNLVNDKDYVVCLDCGMQYINDMKNDYLWNRVK